MKSMFQFGLRCLISTHHLNYSKLSSRGIFRVAVVGSGPAGFYLTQYLLKNPDVHVDIYEKLPVPFGLVRFGVAPDHAEVKNVINTFTATASSDRVSFFGNINISEDITLGDLRTAYNAVALCYGSTKDRPLNIPGEYSANVLSARRFVGWYNGVPEDKSLAVDLGVKDVVVIGHGNVALDCARILLSPVDDILEKTDITAHALKELRRSQVQNVHLIGRRGPLQVAFTIKELREMTKISDCHTRISSDEVSFITSEIISKLPRPRKRLTELIMKIASESEVDRRTSKQCKIRFLRSPIKISESSSLRVSLCANRIEGDPSAENARVLPTETIEHIDCGLLLKSIGYMTVSIDDSIPMDPQTGTIRNVQGRITECGTGLYCSGWAATGAAGVLAKTMNVSFEIAKGILDDIESGNVPKDAREGSQAITQKLRSKGVKFVTFQDWKNIDRLEQKVGETFGKPREKFVDVNDLVAAAKSDT